MTYQEPGPHGDRYLNVQYPITGSPGTNPLSCVDVRTQLQLTPCVGYITDSTTTDRNFNSYKPIDVTNGLGQSYPDIQFTDSKDSLAF